MKKTWIFIERFSMIRTIFNLLFSNILFGFTQFLIIVSLNKFGGLEEVGLYTLALGIVAPITVLLNMGLKVHYNTNKNDDDFINYQIIRIISSVLIIIISILMCLILKYEFSTSFVIFLVASLKSIESILELDYGFLQKKELHNLIAKSNNIRSICLIIWIATCYLILNGNLLILLIGLIIFNIIFYFLYDFNYIKKVKESNKITISIIIKIVITSLPLAVATTFDTLNINIQRIILNYYLGIEKVGIYASLTTIMVTGQLVISSIMTYFLPKLNYFIIDGKRKKLQKVLIYLVSIAFLIGLSLIGSIAFFGEWILPVIFTNHYIPYKNLAVLIMIVGMFWYIAGVLNLAVVAFNEFNRQMFAVIISFLTMLIITTLSVNDFGIYGAAYALIIGMIVRIISFTIILVKKIRRMKT